MSRRRERFETPDGDFLDLDWFDVAPAPRVGADPGDRGAAANEAPLALLLHGLEGSTASTYMYVLARELSARGIASAGLNFRSCSGEMNRRPRFYHSGEFGDLVWVLEQLARRFSDRALAAVGFSLGGNALLRWLGEAGDGAARLVRAAAAVSVPYDLAAGSRYTEQGVRAFYVRHLLASLHRKIAAKRAQLAGAIDVERALAARTFRAFDDAATAPLHGFRDADDYYARASSGPWLRGVSVPTLLVHALDDPFLPREAMPLTAIAANSRIRAAISAQGGHVGFVYGWPWKPRFHAEYAVAEFLAARLCERSYSLTA